ncbi:MAG: hypothetical protein ACK5M3_19225 [Dysgonomonas sp.]
MKKLILTLILGLFFNISFAQSTDREVGTTTNKGQVILPQAGDFALGVDAISLFGLGDHSDKPSFFYSDGFLGDELIPTIYGKYFLTDRSAIRVKLHIGFDSYTDKVMVAKRPITSANEEVEDKTTHKNDKFGITAGYEIRRGYGRLQGYFGPEIGLGFGSSSRSFDPGNAISADYTFATTKRKDSGKFYAKVGGFAGVEYFFGPKMSIGGEVGLGFNLNTAGKSSTTTKTWNTANNQVIEETKDGDRSNSQTDFKVSYASALNVTFYF